MSDGAKNPVQMQHLRCVKCKKIISCPRHNTTKLIEHIRTDHPEVCVVKSKTDIVGCSKAAAAAAASCLPQRCSEKNYNKKKGPNSSYTPRYDKAAAMPKTMAKTDRGHLFRVSIESWRPANGMIYCPFCCCRKAPMIKMRNESQANNSKFTSCLLACWPFCFLPFLVPGNQKQYLYCSNCNSFLGLYDRLNNCIRPNRKFSQRMSCGQNPNPGPTECTRKCPKLSPKYLPKPS